MIAESWDDIKREAAKISNVAPPQLQQVVPPEPKPIDTKKELAVLLSPVFGIIAPAWEVTDDEIDLLAESYADAINKYFPDGLSLGVEVGAIMSTVMIFGPRWGKPRKISAPKKQAQPGQTSEQSQQSKPSQKPAAQAQSSRGQS